MLVRLAVRLVMLGLVFALIAWIVPGLDVNGGFGALLWIALLFSVVNLVIGTILRVLSLPFLVLTLGLILVVINAALIAITAGLSSHLDCDSFGAALLAGLLLGLFSWIGEWFLAAGEDRHARNSSLKVA